MRGPPEPPSRVGDDRAVRPHAVYQGVLLQPVAGQSGEASRSWRSPVTNAIPCLYGLGVPAVLKLVHDLRIANATLLCETELISKGTRRSRMISLSFSILARVTLRVTGCDIEAKDLRFGFVLQEFECLPLHHFLRRPRPGKPMRRARRQGPVPCRARRAAGSFHRPERPDDRAHSRCEFERRRPRSLE